MYSSTVIAAQQYKAGGMIDIDRRDALIAIASSRYMSVACDRVCVCVLQYYTCQ